MPPGGSRHRAPCPGPAPRWRRGSSRSRCTGTGARRGGAAVVAGEVGALLVDQRLGAHHDARRAEAALQGAAGGERVGVAVALGGVEPSSGDDRLAGRPWRSRCWQLTTALPSISTVQQPHWPDGEQPSFGEVTSSSSRSAASRWGWSARRTPACRSARTRRCRCPARPAWSGLRCCPLEDAAAVADRQSSRRDRRRNPPRKRVSIMTTPAAPAASSALTRPLAALTPSAYTGSAQTSACPPGGGREDLGAVELHRLDDLLYNFRSCSGSATARRRRPVHQRRVRHQLQQPVPGIDASWPPACGPATTPDRTTPPPRHESLEQQQNDLGDLVSGLPSLSILRPAGRRLPPDVDAKLAASS